VVRQDLPREHGVEVSLRTVERAAAPPPPVWSAVWDAEVCRRERDGRLTLISDGYSLPIVSSQSWIAVWKPTHSNSSAAAGWSDLVKI
jgi:hypothetical protein